MNRQLFLSKIYEKILILLNFDIVDPYLSSHTACGCKRSSSLLSESFAMRANPATNISWCFIISNLKRAANPTWAAVWPTLPIWELMHILLQSWLSGSGFFCKGWCPFMRQALHFFLHEHASLERLFLCILSLYSPTYSSKFYLSRMEGNGA